MNTVASSVSAQTANLFDVVEDLISTESGVASWSLDCSRSAQAYPDASVFFSGSESDGAGLADLLRSQPEIASVQRRGRRISIRFADDVLADAGRAVEEGRGLMTSDLLQDRSFVVDFCDPNATKALHIGHLRNLTLGNAMASALEAAGAAVVRQSVVCDIGRNVCEAMAGYVQYFDGENPWKTGTKSDAFVGRCYSSYVRSLDGGKGSSSGPDAPIAREIERRDDLAQKILERWLVKEAPVRSLWSRIRTWALTGQEITLARLNLHFDRTLYESDAMDRFEQIVERGLDRRLFRHDSEGAVIYETGRPDYPVVPLVRSDGFPTEHMRAIALWLDLADATDDACIHVMGDEWLASTIYREGILEDLAGRKIYAHYHKIPYGMVLLDGSKMKSSTGVDILIDDMIDRVTGLDALRALVDHRRDVLAPLAMAKIVMLGYFLGRPHSKPIHFSWHDFEDERRNPGWRLVRAWSRAESRASGSDPDPADRDYRFGILQSQLLRRMVGHAVTTYDVSILARYVINLADWYLEAPASARLDRIVHLPLRIGLGSLGLLSLDG